MDFACRFRVGQNLYREGKTKRGNYLAKLKAEWTKPLDDWYGEIHDFKQDPTRPVHGLGLSGAGHFTQMVWAKTQYIGCGYIAHDGWYGLVKVYVCNYGPAGNWNGQRIYGKGPPCSRCPAGTFCNRGLCRDNDYNTIIVDKHEGILESSTNASPPWISPHSTVGPKEEAKNLPKCDLKILKKYINSCEV